MKTTYTDVRVNTKVEESDYIRLQDVCRQYGIKSVYQILQTLIEILCRTVDTTRDRQHQDGVPVELSKIITEALAEPKKARRRAGRR